MATAFRDFYFYEEYEWRHDDFANFQTWMKARIKGMAEGIAGGSVLQGLQVVPLSGMTVRVKAGIAQSPTGQLLLISSDTDVEISSPTGNPARTMLVVRPKLTDTNDIPEPLNPSNSVPLHQMQEAEIVEIPGTPSPTPVYQTPQAEDVKLMGFLLASGHSTIIVGNYEMGQRHAPRNLERGVTTFTETGTIGERDQICEVDASASGIVMLLPDVKDYVGKTIDIVRIDSATSNPVSVSGSISGQTIDAQAVVTLDDQWQRLRLYGRPNRWGSI